MGCYARELEELILIKRRILEGDKRKGGAIEIYIYKVSYFFKFHLS